MQGLDMRVKFGYCITCDNGPDGKNRDWVEDLLNNAVEIISKKVTTCKHCKVMRSLLSLEVDVPGLGLTK